MGFQNGDVPVQINRRPHTLRLTIGALVEISYRLYAPSPQVLSQHLRTLTSEQARVLLTCLSCPPLCGAGRSVDTVSEDEMKVLLPEICRVFEQAFADPKDANGN